MKVADLDLDKCINACRASELSKERNRTIKATSETVRRLTSGNKRDQGGRDDKDGNRKLIRKCKFCVRQHQQGNFPAYGVECQKCHKSNHFTSVCMSRKPKPVHTVESDDKNTSNYHQIKTVDLNPNDEINVVTAR